MQRRKNLGEDKREAVTLDEGDSCRRLGEYRSVSSEVETAPIKLGRWKRRCEISEAKQPFLDAVLGVLEERRAFLPIAVRSIHYCDHCAGSAARRFGLA